MKFILFLLFLSTSAIAQQRVQLQVLSAADSSAVPYANFLVKGTSTGTFSDQQGYIDFIIEKGDTVVISAVGFTSKRFPVQRLPTKIYLAEELVELAVVNVAADVGKWREKSIGYKRRTWNKIGISLDGTAVKSFDNPSNSQSRLLSFRAYIYRPKDTDSSSSLAYQLIVSLPDDQGRPTQVIYSDSTARYIEGGGEKYLEHNFDNLWVPPGKFFVGMRMVGMLINGEFVPHSTAINNREVMHLNFYESKEAPDSYMKLAFTGKWYFWGSGNERGGMGLGSYDNKTSHLNFGIKLEYLK